MTTIALQLKQELNQDVLLSYKTTEWYIILPVVAVILFLFYAFEYNLYFLFVSCLSFFLYVVPKKEVVVFDKNKKNITIKKTFWFAQIKKQTIPLESIQKFEFNLKCFRGFEYQIIARLKTNTWIPINTIHTHYSKNAELVLQYINEEWL